MYELLRLAEPALLFDYGQSAEDPRDGLTLFGPLDKGKPYGIRAGVIGTKKGIEAFKGWVHSIQGPVFNAIPQVARPPFPGFEAAFQIPWEPTPNYEIELQDSDLDTIYLDDKHQRVYKTVDAYASRILGAIREEEITVDIWFVIVPDALHKYCRPLSYIPQALRIEAASRLPVGYAQKLQTQPSLFTQDNQAAIPYHYDVNFHNQLKARLLGTDTPTQILVESTLSHPEGRKAYTLRNQESAIAWGIATTAFYKAGGRPWKISGIRDGVCYIGLVFKQDDKNPDPRSSCCAAQMFLDSGDGLVFKGDVGPWHTPGRGEFHLSREAARELIKLAVDTYTKKRGSAPEELFIHGKVRFNDEEWKGFLDAVGPETNLVGIRIREETNLKLYRKADRPVLRGLAYVRDTRTAYLWTRGYIPRLQTYPGREVPNPLLIDVCRGNVAIETVLNDIMALTKLNYNTCIFADGQPVTLKFADAVGEILTAGPIPKQPPLAFKFYI